MAPSAEQALRAAATQPAAGAARPLRGFDGDGQGFVPGGVPKSAGAPPGGSIFAQPVGLPPTSDATPPPGTPAAPPGSGGERQAILDSQFAERYLARCGPALRASFMTALGADGSESVEEILDIPLDLVERDLREKAVLGDPAVPLTALQVGKLRRAYLNAVSDTKLPEPAAQAQSPAEAPPNAGAGPATDGRPTHCALRTGPVADRAGFLPSAPVGCPVRGPSPPF